MDLGNFGYKPFWEKCGGFRINGPHEGPLERTASVQDTKNPSKSQAVAGADGLPV